MSQNLIRKVARGPHAGKLAVVVHECPASGILSARVAATIGEPAPSPYNTRIQLTLFQPSYLKPL